MAIWVLVSNLDCGGVCIIRGFSIGIVGSYQVPKRPNSKPRHKGKTPSQIILGWVFWSLLSLWISSGDPLPIAFDTSSNSYGSSMGIGGPITKDRWTFPLSYSHLLSLFYMLFCFFYHWCAMVCVLFARLVHWVIFVVVFQLLLFYYYSYYLLLFLSLAYVVDVSASATGPQVWKG